METGENLFTTDEIISLFQKYGTGYRKLDNPLFEEGNKLIKPFIRLGVLSVPSDGDCHKQNHIFCNVPNCNQEFDTVFSYESHYNSIHRFMCSQCHKTLPSGHLLDLHLSENHDSFFIVSSEKHPMFACYLEECKQKSWNPKERRHHCISVHKLPHDFRFGMLLKQKKIKSQKDDKMDLEETTLENETKKNSTTIAADSKKFKYFSFGHTSARAFDKSYSKLLSKTENSNPTDVLENDKMVLDLIESLPE